MATPPTSNLGVQNWYASTLSQSCGSTDTTLYITVVPSVSEGYLVIDPNNTSTREVIHFTSVGAGTISIPTTGDRGLDGTSAQSHAQGTDVELHYTTSYFTALQSGNALAANAIATTALFSANLYSNAIVSLANAGSGGGTIWYRNNGGIKELWGVTATIGTSGNAPQQSATVGITFPGGFFNSVQRVLQSTAAVGAAGNGYIEPYLATVTLTQMSSGIIALDGVNLAAPIYFDVKGV